MTAARISAEIQSVVVQRANFRCEYCCLDEWLSGIPCEIDHIVPVSAGGTTTLDNLALACSHCNRHKATRVQALDPVTGLTVALFHPRRDSWARHFAWSESGVHIVGVSEIGRATVAALLLNHPRVVSAREHWVTIGRQPPKS